MDTITQAALGALIGEAAFRRRLGGAAVIAGAVGATIPDLDQFAALGGDTFSYIRAHRAFSHSLLFALLLAPALAAAARWLRPAGRWRDWIGVFFWSIVTHPLLDICTSYGTMFLTPFSDTRYAIDAVAVLDLFYTVPLIVALILCHRWRLHPIKAGVAAWLVLGLTTLYLADGWRIGRIVAGRAEAQLRASGVVPVEVRAHPQMFQLWARRVVARDAGGNLWVGMASWLAPDVPIRFSELRRPDDPRVAELLETEPGRFVRWFASEPVHAVVGPVDASGRTEIRLEDQRFALPAAPAQALWGATVTLGAGEPEWSWGNYPREWLLSENLAALWRIVRTGSAE